VLKVLEFNFGESVLMHVYMILLVVTCITAFGWLIALIKLRIIHSEKTIFFTVRYVLTPLNGQLMPKVLERNDRYDHSNYLVCCIKRNYFSNGNATEADMKSFICLVLISVEEI
jgi:hypothetical protein